MLITMQSMGNYALMATIAERTLGTWIRKAETHTALVMKGLCAFLRVVERIQAIGSYSGRTRAWRRKTMSTQLWQHRAH